jgi:hypothetical protein
MSRLVITAVILFIGVTAFSQLYGIDDFVKLDKNAYLFTASTEQEAVNVHRRVLDANGFDVVRYMTGSNPVLYAYFNLDTGSKMGTFIINRDFKYEILFIELPVDYMIDRDFQLIKSKL